MRVLALEITKNQNIAEAKRRIENGTLNVQRFMEKAVYWTIPSSAKKLQLATTFQNEAPSEAIIAFESNQEEGDDQLEDDILKL